ncbi:unnamed protein product [Lota lota]
MVRSVRESSEDSQKPGWVDELLVRQCPKTVRTQAAKLDLTTLLLLPLQTTLSAPPSMSLGPFPCSAQLPQTGEETVLSAVRAIWAELL